MPNSEQRPIRRCVCGDITFEELKNLGVTTLQDAGQFGCGVNCGLCRAYIAAMIATGETEFAAD